MPLEGNDELLVNRSGTTYTLEQQNLMAEIQNDDLLLVNRSGATYTATGQELIDSVIPDLEIVVTFIPNIPYIDEVITVVPNTSGGVEPEGGYTFTYQWTISDDIDGNNATTLIGANSNTYTPTEDQSGKFLGCTVQTTDDRGTIANATGRTGPIDYRPANEPPVISSVVLTQDEVNDKRFATNSFTTTVTATNRPNQLAMEAHVVGALSLAIGTDVITTEDPEGGAPTVLTLASDVNLGDGRFEVGDEVKTNDSYQPETSAITNVAAQVYDLNLVVRGLGPDAPKDWTVLATNELFDGDLTTGATAQCGNQNQVGSYSFDFTYLPGGGIPFTNKVRINLQTYYSGGLSDPFFEWGSSTSIGINNGTKTKLDNSTAPNGWFDLASGSGLLTSFDIDCWSLKSPPGYGGFPLLRALEVDGEILVGGQSTLTLADDKDVKYFQAGDEVQDGGIVVSRDPSAPEIVVEGGSWYNVDNSQAWGKVTIPNKDTQANYTYDRAYDGVVEEDGSETHFAAWLAGSGNVTITFPSLQINNYVAIYSGDGLNGASDVNATISGNTSSVTGYGYQSKKVFTGSGSLTSIELTQSGGGVRFYGIEIDGKVLVNPSNSSALWSSQVTCPGNPTDGIRNVPNMFDGDLETTAYPSPYIAGEADTLVWQPPGQLSYNTLEVLCKTERDNREGLLYKVINDIERKTGSLSEDDFNWVSIPGPNTIEYLEFSRTAPSFGNIQVRAIRVDGEILIDKVNDSQNWSSLVTLSGALSQPITKLFDNYYDDFNDGNWSITPSASNQRSTATFNPPLSIPAGAKVELRGFKNSAAASDIVFVNGNDVSSKTPNEFSDQGWFDVTAEAGNEINTIAISRSDPGDVIPGCNTIMQAIRINGETLVDDGVTTLGNTKVFTTSPKQGEGTIGAIDGSTVTINPVVDNCFREGQYLIHTTPKPIKITPVSEVITDVNTIGNELTLAGNDELIEFAAGDPVKMANADGSSATALLSTSPIVGINTSGTTSAFISSVEGQNLNLTSFDDNAVVKILMCEEGLRPNRVQSLSGAGPGGNSGSVYYREISVKDFKATYGNTWTFNGSNNFGGEILLNNGTGGNGGVTNGGQPHGTGGTGTKMSPQEAIDQLNASYPGIIFSLGNGGTGGSGAFPLNSGGGGGGAGGLVTTLDEPNDPTDGVLSLPPTPSAEDGTGAPKTGGGGGAGGLGGTGWGAGGGGNGAYFEGADNGSAQPGNGAGSLGIAYVVLESTELELTDATNLEYFKAGDELVNGPSTGFKAIGYLGQGGTNYPFTGVGFSPDLVWAKCRDKDFSSVLFDTVRGPFKSLTSNTTDPEQNDSNALVSFDEDGFSAGDHSGINASGDNYVAWCWDAGDNDPVTNTDGTVDSTVKASNETGFSIVKFDALTNCTVGHGLDKEPSFIIYKCIGQDQAWRVYHKDNEVNRALYLNSTAGPSIDTDRVVDVDASTFKMGDVIAAPYIAYVWKNVPGKTNFGGYVGNTVVNTGFKPSFVMIKRANQGAADDGDAYGGWTMFTPGVTGSQLMANCSNPETIRGNCANPMDLQYTIEFTDTGFKFGDGYSWYETNDSGFNYVYMAFASQEVIGTVLEDADLLDKTLTVAGGTWDNSNQSEVWSDDLSFLGAKQGEPTDAFDGNLSTSVNSSTSGDPRSNAIVFTPDGGLPYTEGVKVYCPTGDLSARLNGGPWVNFTTEGVLATGSGVILTIEVTEQRTSASFGVSAYEVDGKLLVDAVNDSQIWSQNLSLAAGASLSSRPVSNAFDGDLTTFAEIDGGIGTLTFDSPIENVTSFRFYIGDRSNGDRDTFFVNGTDYTTVINTLPGWNTISTPPSTITSIGFGTAGANVLSLGAIEVNGKLLVDQGARYLGETTAKVEKSGEGVVESVDLVANTMTLSSTNGEWIPGYYATTPEKNAVEMRGYLSFDSAGNNVDLERLPQSPVLMDDVKAPKLNFPATFSTGEGVDTDLPYPTYLETYVVASNDLGSSSRVASNELFPVWTGQPLIAPRSYRVMQDEFADWCYWACSSDYRSAIKTIQDAGETVQELRTKAETMAQNFLNRDDVY